ncbi:MAG: dihydropteroate synthase [Planctomycetota bacterium]
MGILNVTPDSFSDGGRFADHALAAAHGTALARAGAAVIDVGGESTRPGYTPVADEEQIRRTVPAIAILRQETDALISIDTTRSAVAEAALAAGADLVNDTSALQEDAGLADVIAASGCQVVLMHRFAPPRSAADRGPALAEIRDALAARVEFAQRRGIAQDRIVVDPGIGFGTRADDVPAILAHIEDLRSLGCPLLVGPSRKSFLQPLTEKPVGERAFGTAAAVAALTLAGVELLRVHDVAAMLDVVRVAAAIRNARQ